MGHALISRGQQPADVALHQATGLAVPATPPGDRLWPRSPRALPSNPAQHLSIAERRRRITAIAGELELHVVLESLFRRMPGVEWAEVTHGTQEFGKDLVFCATDVLGDRDYTGVVVKLGKITGAASGSASLGTVKRQVEQVAKIPFPNLREKGVTRMNRVLVVCTESISGNAQTEILACAPTDYINVTFWDGERLEQMLFQHYPEFFVSVPVAVAEYLKRFCDLHRELTPEHRRLGGHSTRKLSEIFVDPTMIYFDEEQFAVRPRKRKAHGATRLVSSQAILRPESFGVKALTTPPKNVFVMGPPGCGKSVLLKKAAFDLAEAYYSGTPGVPFPLFATARTLLEHLDSQSAVEVFYRSMPLCQTFETKELHAQLSNHPAVLYVDGLDEIADKEHRVLDFVTELTRYYPSLRVVIATRLSYFQKPKNMPGFRQALVLPMNVRGMQQLLERILGRGQKSMSVLRAVLDSGLYRSLPQTPLVVTILAILHEQERLDELPANVADLYDMVLQVYLGRWSVGLWGMAGNEEYAIKVEVLKRIAAEMHGCRATRMPLARADAIIREYLATRGYKELSDRLLNHLVSEAAALHRQSGSGAEPETVEFIHHSFQEFFCARWLDDHRERVPMLVPGFADPWWGSVLSFYAGIRKDVPDLIDGIVNAGPPANALGALSASLQLGHLLQAANQSPIAHRERGCLYGTDLMQYFYGAYAEMQREGKVAIKFTRLQLMFSLAILFGISYGSLHLAGATKSALERLVVEFEAAEDNEKRFLVGLRLICAATALAERGDWSGVELFVTAARLSDFPLLQTAATMLETFGDVGPKGTKTQRWERVARAFRQFAPKGGADALRKVDDRLKPMKGAPRLLGPREPAEPVTESASLVRPGEP